MRPASKDLIVVLAGTVSILLPALINGFPFVYSDSGTYIRSAFQGYVPVDRPFWYGILMRIFSLGGHYFWTVIMVQALLCASYILRTVRFIMAPGTYHWQALVLMMMLAGTSSLGYFADLLIPDIFTAIGMLALLFVLYPQGGRPARALDLAVLLVSCWVHLSNLLIIPLTGVTLLVLLKHVRRAETSLRWIRLGICTLLAWLGLGLSNLIVDGSFYLSRGGHVFLVARLLDSGLLRPWLQEHCPTNGHRLCHYVDELPATSTQFLWSEDLSPMHKEGGWLATKPEYDRIVREVLLDPSYLIRFITAGFRSTGLQLAEWHICEGLMNPAYRKPDSPPYVMIANTIPSALPAYRASLQNGGRGELIMAMPNRVNATAQYTALLAMIMLLMIGGRTTSGIPVRALLLFALCAVVINCGVCASLSVVEDRYLSRVSWLFIGIVLAVVLDRMPRLPKAGYAGDHPTRRQATIVQAELWHGR